MDYKAEINSWTWRFKRAGENQETMAEKAVVSLATLNKIIKGKTKNPKIETVRKISETLAELEKKAGIKEGD